MHSPQGTGTIPGLPRGAGKAGKPVFSAGVLDWRAARGAGADGQPDGSDRRGGKPAELETVKLGNWPNLNGEAGKPAELGMVRLGNRPNRNGEAGKPAKLERRGWETGRAGTARLDSSRAGTVTLGNQRNWNCLAGNRPSRAAQPYKAPFISYMKGALLHCAA